MNRLKRCEHDLLLLVENNMDGLLAVLVVAAWVAMGFAIWDMWRIKTGRKYGVKR